MALFVDPAIWPWRGMLFCHLVSDTGLDELHAFARWIGAPPRAFGGDHYDIGELTREVAIDEGALAVTSRQLVRALYRSGVRLPRSHFGTAICDSAQAGLQDSVRFAEERSDVYTLR